MCISFSITAKGGILCLVINMAAALTQSEELLRVQDRTLKVLGELKVKP